MKEKLMIEINQLVNEITVVTDYLYQQRLSEGYKGLDGLLANIMTVIDQLFSYKTSASFSFDENKLVKSLTEAMKAMEVKDSIMLADILSLDIMEQFTDIEYKISL